jgi:threonine dehydratase
LKFQSRFRRYRVRAASGGLAAGTALQAQARIFAVEPEEHNDIQRTLAAGSIQRNAPGVRSICDGLLTEQMGEITYAIARERFERVIAVSDAAVLRAMKFAFQRLKLVPNRARRRSRRCSKAAPMYAENGGVIASGGNVDIETLSVRWRLAAALQIRSA